MAALARRFDAEASVDVVALFVVDDGDSLVPVLRLAVKQANRSLHGCQIIVEHAASAEDGVAKLLALQPDVCFVDRLLPDGGGQKIVDLAQRTHAQFATLSAFSLREAAQRRSLGSVGGKPQVADFKKRPELLIAPFRHQLINLALEQADTIRYRYRKDPWGTAYQIGGADYIFGANVIAFPNGLMADLQPWERDVLSFFCMYPRATFGIEDLNDLQDLEGPRGMDQRLRSKLLAEVVGSLNQKLDGFARFESQGSAGYGIDAAVSVLKLADVRVLTSARERSI
jgi:hypothetical protein